MIPEVAIPQPKVNVVNFTKEELPKIYEDLRLNNGLLTRIEQSLKLKGWSDLEIRTSQLQVAVASCQSLQRRIKELENARDLNSIVNMEQRPKGT